MSDLTFAEKMCLEKAFDMGTGYVLGFSNRTFQEFFFSSTNINIYDPKYAENGDSKANRLRTFWDTEPNYIVGKLLNDLIDSWSELKHHLDPESPPEKVVRIVRRLQESAPVPDLAALDVKSRDKGFEALAKSVRQSIENNEPETGLDRLHTFLVRYFHDLCEKHKVKFGRETPLHSLVGGYVKALKKENLIESEMTERILKSSISVMEAFNRVRNEHSFAHNNEVLNYNESLLIVAHVTSSIRFIEAIESSRGAEVVQEVELDWDDLPF